MRSSRWRSWPYRASGVASPRYRRASREIRRAATGPGPEARRHVDQKLCDYLLYSREYSPYWKERWPRDAPELGPENAREVLAMLPPLGKEALREHEEQLHIRPEQRRSGDGFPPIVNPFPNWSGGSTGIPTRIWQDGYWSAANRAAIDFAYRSVELEPGVPTFYLWGSENELRDIRKTFSRRASSWLRGLIVMPAFSLDPARMEAYIRLIDRRTDVQSALCFVSAADTFTRYLEREARRPRRLARVVTGGGTLLPDLRKRIREYLADDVYDLYGSRDLGLMAMETPSHEGLAICSWHNYLEVLDEDGRPVEPGGSGRIHVTALDNHSTALIRFDLGDVATLSEEGEIAWNGPVLRHLAGRTAEHLIASDGSRIEPAAVVHLIGVVLRPAWLRKFQMVQQGPADFRLRVETWEPVGASELERLREDVRISMERLCRAPANLVVDATSAIEPSPSGKHLYCVQEWRPDPSGAAR